MTFPTYGETALTLGDLKNKNMEKSNSLTFIFIIDTCKPAFHSRLLHTYLALKCASTQIQANILFISKISKQSFNLENLEKSP